MSLNCIIKHIKERLFNEQGAGTVEYVIVVLVAIVIGSGLLAFGNQVSWQVTKTGGSISSWFSKANGTDGETPGTVQLKKINGSSSVFSGQSSNFHIGMAAYLADTQKPVKMVAHLSSTKYGNKDVEFSSGLPTLNNAASDRTNFGYSDSLSGIVTGNPWNFD